MPYIELKLNDKKYCSAGVPLVRKFLLTNIITIQKKINKYI